MIARATRLSPSPLALLTLLLGCSAGEPPGPRMQAQPEPLPSAQPDAAQPLAASSDTQKPAASSDAQPSALPADAQPLAPPGDAQLLAATDAHLPQTEARPDPRDALTQARGKALFSALVAGDAELAKAFFFPLDAYKQVKDVGNPERDWNVRLIGAFQRDVRELAQSRKSSLARGEFVELHVPEAAMRWVRPGEEYNKIGYFRVFGSQLRYRDGERIRSIPVKSLISWRGQLYVVHLSSFK